jgi:two-component system phosphate regulon sensor histidine kinase PhoR
MLESFLAVSLHFTVEFLGFLATAGGAVLVVSRPGLVPAARADRFLAGAGLATLAIGQLLHGAAFLADDGAEALAALWTIGFLLIVAGASGALGQGANLAVGGLSFREPFLLIPAGAGLVASIGLLIRGSKKGAGGLRLLAAASLLLAASQAITALDPTTDLSTNRASGYVYAAHAVKLLGFVVLGAWLWAGVRASIRGRFAAAFATLLVVVVLALSTALTGVISVNVANAQLRGVGDELDSALADLERETSDLIRDTAQIATLPVVRAGIARGPRPGPVAQLVLNRLDFHSVDFVAVLDARGAVLASSSRAPRLQGRGASGSPGRLSEPEVVNIVGSPLIAGDLLENERPSGGVDLMGDTGIPAVLAGAPVRNPAGTDTAGFIVAARYLDEVAAQNIAALARPARVSIVVDAKVVASTLDGRVTARELVPESMRDDLTAGGSARRQQTIGGKSFFSAFAPLEDADGSATGATLALSTPASVVANTRDAVIRILFLVALAAGFVVLLLAWASGRRISRPIQLLTAAAREVREGNLSATAPVAGDDEVGQLGETFNDMTAALKRQTGELRAAARDEHDLRERIEKIVQSMADGLVAVDSDGSILAFNAEAEVMTGLEAQDVMGKPVREVVMARDLHGDPVKLPIFEPAEGSLAGIFLERHSGEPVPISLTSAVLRDEEGNVAGGVAVLRDMTHEREIDRMKSDFLANISHELRTPLTPIKGYAEILGTKDVPPEKSKTFARGILQSTERLERIVALLVDFSALEAGRLAPNAKPVDMKDLVEKLASEWRQRAPTHHVEVDVEHPLPKVMGDARLLRRSLGEILDNAVKFSPSGGTIRVQARGVGPNGQKPVVELVVSDEGIGIAPEDLPNLFLDFHQLDPSQTRAFGGLGLGLAFVRRIIEAHDGTVEVESEQDRGTRLTIKIPAAGKPAL